MKAEQPLLYSSFILPASSLLFIGQTRTSQKASAGAVRQRTGSIMWSGGRCNAGVHAAVGAAWMTRPPNEGWSRCAGMGHPAKQHKSPDAMYATERRNLVVVKLKSRVPYNLDITPHDQRRKQSSRGPPLRLGTLQVPGQSPHCSGRHTSPAINAAPRAPVYWG